MKNIRFRLILVAIAFLVMAGCTKIKDPVVKNDHVQVFSDHAVFTWEVEYEAQAASVVELGSTSDMGDARRYGSESLTDNKLFNVTVDQLIDDATYYYRFVVLVGEKEFTTDLSHFTIPMVNLPMVTTLDVTEVGVESATVGGEVTVDSDGEVTERGFCWATEEMPDLNDSVVVCGAGTGAFTAQLSGLQQNTVYYVRAYAKNFKGVAYGEVKNFKTERIPTVPMLTTLRVVVVTATSVSCDVEVVDEGGYDVTERGVCWGTNDQQLTVEGEHLAAETAGPGEFTVVISELGVGKQYFFRGYAINSLGVAYGETLSLTTYDGLPVVKTLSVSDITTITAVCCGEVIDPGLSDVRERGFCWSLTENPTIDDFHVKSFVNGIGVYNCTATHLTDSTVYHLRAYCRNRQGISYGEEIVFATLPSLPVVSTFRVSEITAHSAWCGGRVESDGGHAQVERGICWSTSPNPTVDGNHLIDPSLAIGMEVNTFNLEMTNLTANTVYYVRAYVTTTVGTSYGEENNFTTLSE